MTDAGPVDPGYRAEAEWLHRWRLIPDGEQFSSTASVLTPVRLPDGSAAMLKVARADEEIRGGALLAAWNGVGAARVLRREGPALLLERAMGPGRLVDWAEGGRDDEATHVLCAAAAALHGASDAVRSDPVTPPLVPLRVWFRQLLAVGPDADDLHRRAADIAAELLDDPRDEVVLHGDVHHGNVLDFRERGWLAIDPKGLIGERAFDYCNLLCNPSHQHALAPGRLERRFRIVTEAAGLDQHRFARWLTAWCGLSSVWFSIDGDPALAASAAEIGRRAITLA